MIVALIDNGSLEPAAHLHLRAVAAALSARTGVKVHPVSWKHSDRVSPEALNDAPAWTLAPFVRTMQALGQREFVFVPFFISPQGAIGSALHRDLEKLHTSLPELEFSFTEGLAARGIVPAILSARVRDTIAAHQLTAPAVVVVDHGGPSATSAALRDQFAAEVRRELGTAIRSLTAASMEGEHGPLLADVLRRPELVGRDVVVAQIFLVPGRHAGPHGDVANICRTALEQGGPRSYLTPAIGRDPAVVSALSTALREHLAARKLALASSASGRDVS